MRADKLVAAQRFHSPTGGGGERSEEAQAARVNQGGTFTLPVRANLPIQRTDYTFAALVQNVGVDHRRGNIRMS